MPETTDPAGARDETTEVGTPAFIEWLNERVSAYTRDPWDAAVQADLRRARAQLTEFFLEASEETLPHAFNNQLAKLHLSIAGGGLRDLPLNEQEQATLDRVLVPFTTNTGARVPTGHMLSAMLYCRPDHPTAAFLHREVADWLYGVFTAFLVIEPVFFDDSKAFSDYCAFAQSVVRTLHGVVAAGAQPGAGLGPKARVSAHTYAAFSCPIQPYFGTGDLRDFSEKRAYVLEQNARASGLRLDWTFPARNPAHKKIRLGVLKPHFSGQTETFATLPVFEHLDRDQFEISLYAVEPARNELERYCASRADRLRLLPRNPPDQAAALRSERLDILFFGSNLTAGVDACTTLALHRLAPVQVASICCPVTTGFSHMDYYVAGDLLAPATSMQSQFRERLINIPGSGICFSFGPEHAGASTPIDRQALGIPREAVMFVSGANYFKITPHVREAWARIVSRVPGSVLVLYPFNPNWSGRYNAAPFIDDIKRRFARQGLGEDRLKILDPLPTRADIKALLGLADVYLDSFPYGGATSLIDTLEAGLPTVVVEGDTLRFRQAGSMLRELSVTQSIADSEASYIELACDFGTAPEIRQRIREAIQQNMQRGPAFLDSRAYADHMTAIFRALHEGRAA